MSSGPRRGRLGISVVGAVLSLAVSAQHAGREDGGGHGDRGDVVAEIVVTESLGTFRNLARLVFLIAAAVDRET